MSSSPLNLPFLTVAAPEAASAPAPAASTVKSGSDSFAKVLAKQQPKQNSNDAPAKTAANTSKTQAAASQAAATPASAAANKSPSKDAANSDAAQTVEAAQAAAGSTLSAEQAAAALALAQAQAQAALPAGAPALPQQALDIAAQAAEIQARVAAANAGAATVAAAVQTAALTQTAQADAKPILTQGLQAAAETVLVPQTVAARPLVDAPAPATPAVRKDEVKTAATAPALPATLTQAAQAPAEIKPEVQLDTHALPVKVDTKPATTEWKTDDTPAFLSSLAASAAPQRQAATDVAPMLPAATPLQVSTPVGATQWGQELSRQMVTFSQNLNKGTHTAELRLDPPDLGPLRVTLSFNDGVASASFVSAHAAVRQAVESALPQLQQALSQAGISLGQTNVGEQSQQQAMAGNDNGGQSGRPGQGQAGNGNGGNVIETSVTPEAILARRTHDGLVNTFA